MMAITRRRPDIPTSYGIAQGEAGMLDWPEVEAVLIAAPVFWVSTVTSPDRPHLVPIWSAWVDDAAYIEGGDDTRWARNLVAGDGGVHLGVDHDGMQVMVRGTAGQVDVSESVQAALADVYDAKYPYRPTGTRFWRIAPDGVLAWKTGTVEAFALTPTQFDFGGAS